MHVCSLVQIWMGNQCPWPMGAQAGGVVMLWLITWLACPSTSSMRLWCRWRYVSFHCLSSHLRICCVYSALTFDLCTRLTVCIMSNLILRFVVQTLVQQNQQQARQVLMAYPQLTKALFQVFSSWLSVTLHISFLLCLWSFTMHEI
jgi:hypothetical protein